MVLTLIVILYRKDTRTGRQSKTKEVELQPPKKKKKNFHIAKQAMNRTKSQLWNGRT